MYGPAKLCVCIPGVSLHTIWTPTPRLMGNLGYWFALDKGLTLVNALWA